MTERVRNLKKPPHIALCSSFSIIRYYSSICFARNAAATFTALSDGSPEKALLPCEGSPRALLCAVPIIAAGDVTGSVGLLTEDRTAQPDAAQLKAVNVAAAFLAKQMEE